MYTANLSYMFKCNYVYNIRTYVHACYIRTFSTVINIVICYALQTVGCDNVLESGMEADACGICNGNNNLATFVSDSASAIVNFGKLQITVLYIHSYVYVS